MNWQTQDTNMSGSNSENNDQSKWMQALSMAALSNGADPSTMLGFATGRLISNLVNNWLGNRNARNDAKAAAKLNGQGVAGQGAGSQKNTGMAMVGSAASPTGTYDFAKDIAAKEAGINYGNLGNPGEIGFNVFTGKSEYNPVTPVQMEDLLGAFTGNKKIM